MPRYLEYLPACYCVLLKLYPSDLRKAYGDEMAAVFHQLLRDEYRRCGARGVALAAAQTFGEFFTVATPRHLTSDWLIAAALSLVITSSVLGSLVGIMTARHPVIHVIIHNCR